MDDLFQETLKVLEASFAALEGQVEKPRKVLFKHSFRFRYEQKSIHQALVQKLARTVSTLHAARILLLNGFVQEQGALQRMLDEFEEDILFLANGVMSGQLTDLHEKYLSYFYEEEFEDPDNPAISPHDRAMVPRKKIRAYIAQMEDWSLDSSRSVKSAKALSKAYSGYVHGASPHIMEMYGGNPPRFHISGMLQTPRIEAHRKDLWNYFYRGMLSFILVAMVFQNHELAQKLYQYRDWFEKQSGTNFGDRQE